MNENIHKTTLYITEELRQQLRKKAFDKEITKNQVVVEALNKYFNNPSTNDKTR